MGLIFKYMKQILKKVLLNLIIISTVLITEKLTHKCEVYKRLLSKYTTSEKKMVIFN